LTGGFTAEVAEFEGAEFEGGLKLVAAEPSCDRTALSESAFTPGSPDDFCTTFFKAPAAGGAGAFGALTAEELAELLPARGLPDGFVTVAL